MLGILNKYAGQVIAAAGVERPAGEESPGFIGQDAG